MEPRTKRDSYLTKGSMLKTSVDTLDYPMRMLFTVNSKITTCWKRSSICTIVYSDRGYLSFPVKKLGLSSPHQGKEQNNQDLREIGKKNHMEAFQVFFIWYNNIDVVSTLEAFAENDAVLSPERN